MRVETSDYTLAGVYPLRLTCNYVGYTNSSPPLDFTWTLIFPCSTTTLTIDPLILSSTVLQYYIGDPTENEVLDANLVTSSPPPPLGACPSLVFSLDDRFGGPLDPTIFTFNVATDTFSINSSDLSQAGQYQMRVISWYDGYPDN